MTLYDAEFIRFDVWIGYQVSEMWLSRPDAWGRMLEIANKFSTGILFGRIDLNNVRGRIYFGANYAGSCTLGRP